MKLTLILILAASFCAFAQESGNVMFQSAGPAGAMAWSFEKGTTAVVKGTPYSATMNNESIQTLADGLAHPLDTAQFSYTRVGGYRQSPYRHL
jgi:hypothetical protein